MTHPGVGPLTALAFVLIIGRAERFQCGKQIAAYLGLVPLEDSSGNRRRLGHITKQGSSMLRFLLWLGWHIFRRERNGALLRVHAVVCAKVLDTADIVREPVNSNYQGKISQC